MKNLFFFLTCFISTAVLAQSRDTVYVADFNARPYSFENSVGKIQAAIDECKRIRAKVLVFEKGRYDIWPEGATRKEYFVSNTSSETEAPSKVKTIGMMLDNIHGLAIEGNDATLVYHGKMTTVVMDNCKNIHLKNLHIDFQRPSVSELTYTMVGNGEVEVLVHPDTWYQIVDGKIHLLGEGWRSNKNHCVEYHPQNDIFTYSQGWSVLEKSSATEIKRNHIRFKTPESFHPEVGNTLTVRDIIRDQSGMLLLESKDITFSDIFMHSMGGIGIMSQYTENITMQRVTCAPPENSGRLLASSADMMHFSGCRGKIIIDECYFSGGQDDPVNVHGTNLRIMEKTEERSLKLRFMHHQSYGFNVFFPGDEVAFVNASTMLRYATSNVVSVKRLSDREVEVQLDRPLPPELKLNHDCLENLTYTPELEVRNSYFTHTNTRGLLVTTPRKVVIENNTFYKTGMNAILIEGDAEGWYESGPVKDVLIKDNTFVDCGYSGGPGNAVIAIHPSNTVVDANNPVHKNIRIENNVFKTFDYPVLYAKSTGGLKFIGNTIERTNTLQPSSKNKNMFMLDGCKDVQVENTKYAGDVLGRGLELSKSNHDLQFNELSQTWDEGMPLGNGVVGSLVWEKEECLRMSLDRVDLWDLRPSDSLSGPNYSFDWVYEQVMKKDYLPVQKKLDHPYDRLPAPSKIPGAGLEFSLDETGKPQSVHLYLNNAVCEISWANGMKMQTFVHAFEPVGWFMIENAGESFIPELVPPVYNDSQSGESDLGPVTGQDLRRLGYAQGDVVGEGNRIVYHQKGWGDFYYDVAVEWKKNGNTLTGVWSISSSLSEEKAIDKVSEAMSRGIHADYQSHMDYWNNFWKQSSIAIPDEILAKQYANEMYKFGSVARENSYPISLQAVWTADNGKLPPWKGDYHHDLNTQLSYWPCYAGNHLSEGLGYLNTLWEQREENRKYTREYFGKNGLNVPGVCTLDGIPMAGWIQYSMSPTIGAWLSQHFYLHYKYSMDKDFLRERAYPYLKEVATFLEEFTYLDQSGVRQLPLSSSPEIYDNSINAWFHTMTNYDLSLLRFAFSAASELAGELSLTDESKHWERLYGQLPAYDLDEKGGLTFANGFPYNESHRHFSNAMAIHPLGLIDWGNGGKDRQIIKTTIENFEKFGPDYWTGYSYSWFGNLKARAMDGEGAANELRTFAQHFCLKNTFHANGDQTKSGKSKFTYRPFTLEGNFAFASGIQEMLLQSHTGIVRVFPAIPISWMDVSFDKLRTQRAFLVSAQKENGKVVQVTVFSEKGGVLRLDNPFENHSFTILETGNAFETNILTDSTQEHDNMRVPFGIKDNIIELNTIPGQTIIFASECKQ